MHHNVVAGIICFIIATLPCIFCGNHISRWIFNIQGLTSLFSSPFDVPCNVYITNSSAESSKRNLITVSFVNGIFYSEEDWSRVVNQLCRTFDCPVRPFYNPSTGNWAADFSSAGMQLFIKPNDLELAKELTTHLRSLLRTVGPHGRVLHIAHSGGAILTYLAAKHHLTIQERERLDIIIFGGGCSITRKYFPGHLVNYYSRIDPLVFIDHRANNLRKFVDWSATNSTDLVTWLWQRLSSALPSTYLVSAVNPAAYTTKTLVSPLSAFTTNVTEVLECKYNSSFVFMSACTTNPIVEHSMEGPTYRLALDIEALELLQRREKLYAAYLASLRRETSIMTDTMSRIRTFRKQAAKLTGWRHFWKKANIISLLYDSSFRVLLKKTRNILFNSSLGIDHEPNFFNFINYL